MTQSRTHIFLNNLSVQTLVTFIMGVLEMSVFAVLSRLLSKSDFGYFAALSGIMSISSSIAEAGLGSAVIQKKDATDTYRATAFTLSVLFGLFVFFIVFGGAPFLAKIVLNDKTMTMPLRVMSFSLIINSFLSFGVSVLYKEKRFKRVGVLQVTSYVLSSCVGIFLAYKGYGVWAIVTYTMLTGFFLVLFIYSTSVRFPKLGLHRDDVPGITSFGGWLTLGVVLNNITGQIDKILMPRWVSVEALGAYNRPAGFVSNISTRINSVFDTVLFPSLSELQDEPESVKSIFYRSVSLLNSFSVILSSTFFFNAYLLIRVFFGEQWIELSSIMRIVSLSVVFAIDGRLVDCFFRGLNYVKLGFWLRFLGVVITFICFYIGAKYGILGIACGFVVSNLIIIVTKMCFLCKKIKARVSHMFKLWIIAWRPIIPIMFIGVLYHLLVPENMLSSFLFAGLFVFIILIEFLFFPRFVGDEYSKSIYPLLSRFVTK